MTITVRVPRPHAASGGTTGGAGVASPSIPRRLIVMGDSIHYTSLLPTFEPAPDMEAKFLELRPGTRFPLRYFSKAVSGSASDNGVTNLGTWMVLYPDSTYWALAYGRNDWNTIGAVAFEANMRSMIEDLMADGRIPILPTIAYSAGSAAGTAPLDVILNALCTEYGIPNGPDLRAYFEANQSEIGGDAHPNDTGKVSINRLWAQMMDAYLDPD